MTGFVYNGYIYTYYWHPAKFTRKAQRKNGVEREITESEYNCMAAAHAAAAMRRKNRK